MVVFSTHRSVLPSRCFALLSRATAPPGTPAHGHEWLGVIKCHRSVEHGYGKAGDKGRACLLHHPSSPRVRGGQDKTWGQDEVLCWRIQLTSIAACLQLSASPCPPACPYPAPRPSPRLAGRNPVVPGGKSDGSIQNCTRAGLCHPPHCACRMRC